MLSASSARNSFKVCGGEKRIKRDTCVDYSDAIMLACDAYCVAVIITTETVSALNVEDWVVLATQLH